MFLPTANDQIRYDNAHEYVYEFVDDSDDRDRFPDWKRRYSGRYSGSGRIPDQALFPGLDENMDFVPDINQNQNTQPDYVEPFLRHHVDPPEFLFGVDMNHNQVIDRFENDTEADYPFRRDHRRYNVYAGVHIAGESRVLLGRLRERENSSSRRSKALYGLLVCHREWPARALRLSLYDMIERVRDDIPDDLQQWTQKPFTPGSIQPAPDPMVARNAVINTLYARLDYGEQIGTSTLIRRSSWDTIKQLPR